jgi:lysophospholipase L1-like esterase
MYSALSNPAFALDFCAFHRRMRVIRALITNVPITRDHAAFLSHSVQGCLVSLLFSLTVFVEAQAQSNVSIAVAGNRFEKNVQAYEAADRTKPPPQNAILLVGDSQFFRWKTVAEDLPEFTIVNRGIDSFQTSDLVYFAERLVVSYHPRMIILHVGGNDVHNGKSPEQVLTDFKSFAVKVRAHLPAIPIAFSSLTPGPARWDEAPKRKEANRLIKEYIATDPTLLFIDLWDAMLTADGQPREDLWVADGVHPNHAGYLLRVRIMRPFLGEPERKLK